LQNDESIEFGYERGVSYKVADSNPIGPGTQYWIDAVATAPGECNGNVPDSFPYICTGKLTFTPVPGQSVYTNPGISDPQLEALDSRFGVINNKNKCDATSAPPDTNIKEYAWGDPAAGTPQAWMDPDPIQQSLTFTTTGTGSNKVYGPMPIANRVFKDYGVLWSSNRSVGKTVSDWPSLYGGSATSYPATSPYAQTTAPFFSPGSNGVPERRMLRLLIVECLTAGGICQPATVRGVGKFFMQKKANTPTDKNIYVEFAGLDLTVLTKTEIRLFR
jgi:hypothetical protein